MAINLTSPITGSAVTGLTSPTYTLVDDFSPMSNGRQKAVTALGGTQAGVLTHTATNPFTITAIRPMSFKGIGQPDANGLIRSVPKNTTKLLVRKGVTPAANQPPQVMLIEVNMIVPAGAETFDKVNVNAAISAAIGALSQQSAGISDTVNTGIL